MKSEQELLIAACAGDVQAQNELFKTRIDPLIRLAYLITRDQGYAQDAVQDALISGARRMGTLREKDRFDAWLKRIVVNQAKTYRRRAQRLVPVEDIGDYAAAEQGIIESPEDWLLAREHQARILFAVDALSERLRVPLVMKYYMDMKEKDIAQALGLPATTVKSRLHAARKKLRAHLAQEEAGEDVLQ